MNDAQIERFLSKVDRSGECWLWRGQIGASGYGKIAFRSAGDRRYLRAHRVAWILEHGDIPGGLLVCHKCDNRACVRVDHLFLGTSLDNTLDAKCKGRLRTGPMPASALRRGERNAHAKLDADKVIEMRRLASTGIVQAEIGRRFGIKQAQVSAVVTGRSWSHIADGVLQRISRSEAGSRRKTRRAA